MYRVLALLLLFSGFLNADVYVQYSDPAPTTVVYTSPAYVEPVYPTVAPYYGPIIGVGVGVGVWGGAYGWHDHYYHDHHDYYHHEGWHGGEHEHFHGGGHR